MIAIIYLNVKDEDEKEGNGEAEDKAVEGEGRLAVEDVGSNLGLRLVGLDFGHGAGARLVLFGLVVVERPEDVAALASLRLGDRRSVHEDWDLKTKVTVALMTS